MQTLNLKLRCFQIDGAPGLPEEGVVEIGPAVEYKGAERPVVQWENAIEEALGHSSATRIVVEGNAPHAVYAMVGRSAVPGADIIVSQGPKEFVLPSRFELHERLPINERVIDATCPVVVLFIGAPGHAFSDSDVAAVGVSVGRVLSVEMPERFITPENYAQVAGRIAMTVRHVVARLRVGGTLFISMSTPVTLAVAVGVHTRNVLVPASSHVRFLERTSGGYFIYGAAQPAS